MSVYCILVAGAPASGKSTIAAELSRRLSLPYFSKDRIKELLFDTVGFRSREEKVALGLAAARILYDTAERLMQCGQPFLLENNFENSTRGPLLELLERYECPAITVLLTGDDAVLYRRFLAREASPERHRGHVVNDCYPERPGGTPAAPPSFSQFADGVAQRGMDRFTANGPRIVVDTTDFASVSLEAIARRIEACREEILRG